MTAAILAVGTEMLGAGRRDTNGDWLAERLERRGVEVRFRATLADDTEAIAAAIRAALQGCDVVVVTGGLGPTEDDRTRQALAIALESSLERDPAMERSIEELFRSRGRPFLPVQARQADKPVGAAWIENPLGSAPGIRAKRGTSAVFALPGVPAEMRAMFGAAVDPSLGVVRVLTRRTLRIGGRTEASVEEQVRDLYATPGVEVTILASAAAGVELLLRAGGATPGEASERLRAVEDDLARRLGPDLYGRDDDTPASAVGAALVSRRASVATAESCTAGLLAATLTEVPGSSAWFVGGLIAYRDALKESLAGVRRATLEAHGAVSEEVALELAQGARQRCGSEFGVGITGIAGPGGATAGKPVGLVHFAVCDAVRQRASRVVWPGDRDLVRRRSVTYALDLLRRFVHES